MDEDEYETAVARIVPRELHVLDFATDAAVLASEVCTALGRFWDGIADNLLSGVQHKRNEKQSIQNTLRDIEAL